MIDGLQHHFPLRITEWLLSAILGTWGLICFFLPDSTWALPVFSGMARMADQHVWGLGAFAIGLTRLVALFINGALYRTPHMRALGAFLSIFIWLQLSFGMLTAEVITMGLALYPWFLVADMFNLSRAVRDAKFSELKLRAMRSGESMRDAKPA